MYSAAKSEDSEMLTEVSSKVQGQLKFLMGAYDRSSKDAEAKDKRFDSLESRVDSLDMKLSSMDLKLDTKFAAVLKALGKQPVIDSSPNQTPLRDPVMLSSSRSQVWNSNFDRFQKDPSLGYRIDLMNLDNRENMLKKIEMPSCDCTGVA